VHLHIQLDLKNLAVEYIIVFLSLLSISYPGWTEFYSLHFGNTCSLPASVGRPTQPKNGQPKTADNFAVP
jgi:hypothetical protein